MTNLAETIFLMAYFVVDHRNSPRDYWGNSPRREWFRLHGDYLLVSLYRQARFV